MKWISLLSALIVLAPSFADASPSATCKTEANGHWVITSYYFDEGIVAVGDAEARKNVGFKVFISKDHLVFPGENCNVAKVSSMKSNAFRRYPLGVDIYCKNKIDGMAFFVANSCEKMLADTGDGVYYILRRQ